MTANRFIMLFFNISCISAVSLHAIRNTVLQYYNRASLVTATTSLLHLQRSTAATALLKHPSQIRLSSFPRACEVVCRLNLILRQRSSFIVLVRNDMVRFRVLTATSMKTAVFCDVAPCGLANPDRRF
jgi:hypothetical protein